MISAPSTSLFAVKKNRGASAVCSCDVGGAEKYLNETFMFCLTSRLAHSLICIQSPTTSCPTSTLGCGCTSFTSRTCLTLPLLSSSCLFTSSLLLRVLFCSLWHFAGIRSGLVGTPKDWLLTGDKKVYAFSDFWHWLLAPKKLSSGHYFQWLLRRVIRI